MNDTIRIFIADDHTIVRSGVQALLETIDDLVVGKVTPIVKTTDRQS